MSKKMKADERHSQILQAALEVAEHYGFDNITRLRIATRAGVSEALVSAIMGTMIETRRTIMRHAVKNEMLTVIAQGLASGNKYAQAADPDLKRKALATLI